MSKGTPLFSIRLSAELTNQLVAAVDSRNAYRPFPWWTPSDFVRVAIREKLQKMIRCRAKRKPTKRRPREKTPVQD